MDDGDARGRRRRRRRRTVGGMIDVAGAYPVLLERGELTRPRRGEGDADLLVSAGGSGVGREVSLGVRVRSARGWGGVRARSGGAMGRGRARARRAGKQRGNARRAGVWRTSARASLGWGTRGNRTRRRLRDRGGARRASGGMRRDGRGAASRARGGDARRVGRGKSVTRFSTPGWRAPSPWHPCATSILAGVWGASEGTGDIIASSYDGGAPLSGVNGISTTMLPASLRASSASVASRTGDRGRFPSLRSCTAVSRCTSRYDGGECGCRGTSTAANVSWSLGAGISLLARVTPPRGATTSASVDAKRPARQGGVSGKSGCDDTCERVACESSLRFLPGFCYSRARA